MWKLWPGRFTIAQKTSTVNTKTVHMTHVQWRLHNKMNDREENRVALRAPVPAGRMNTIQQWGKLQYELWKKYLISASLFPICTVKEDSFVYNAFSCQNLYKLSPRYQCITVTLPSSGKCRYNTPEETFWS